MIEADEVCRIIEWYNDSREMWVSQGLKPTV
jgi:hypothetical protein